MKPYINQRTKNRRTLGGKLETDQEEPAQDTHQWTSRSSIWFILSELHAWWDAQGRVHTSGNRGTCAIVSCSHFCHSITTLSEERVAYASLCFRSTVKERTMGYPSILFRRLFTLCSVSLPVYYNCCLHIYIHLHLIVPLLHIYSLIQTNTFLLSATVHVHHFTHSNTGRILNFHPYLISSLPYFSHAAPHSPQTLLPDNCCLLRLLSFPP